MSLTVEQLLGGEWALVDRQSKWICPVILESSDTAVVVKEFLERYSQPSMEGPDVRFIDTVQRFIDRISDEKPELLEVFTDSDLFACFLASPEFETLGLVLQEAS